MDVLKEVSYAKVSSIRAEKYNIISEIEKYSHIPDKKAILYHNTEGEDISVTYQQLIQQSNK